MRTDEEAVRARGPQYYGGPWDRVAEARPLPHLPRREVAHGPLPDVAATRLSRMLSAQAQHHQGRR